MEEINDCEGDTIDIKSDDLLIAYIRGKPVIGLFEGIQDGPLTDEHHSSSGAPLPTHIG